jgi:acylglycerol lipase
VVVPWCDDRDAQQRATPHSACAAGIITVTFDLRGHGESGKVDGIRGYASFADHVTDLLAVLRYATDRHVGLPVFLFGESMGGAIVAALATQHADDPAVRGLRGLMFASPVFKVADKLLPPPPVMMLLRGVSLLFPKCGSAATCSHARCCHSRLSVFLLVKPPPPRPFLFS